MSTLDVNITIRVVFDGEIPAREALFDLAEAALGRSIAAGEFSGGVATKTVSLWHLNVKEVP